MVFWRFIIADKRQGCSWVRRDFGISTPFFPFTKCTLFFPPLSSCFSLCPCHWHFLPGNCLHSKSCFQIGWSFVFFFTFSSIMCPLTSYSFTLLCCFMDEWIRPIIITLFWFLMDELSQLTLSIICCFLDEWTKPSTLTSLCLFMDEWIKPMRLTLLWFFMDELSHWHSFCFVFSWMHDKWWPPWLKQKLTCTIIEHIIMSWFHPLCRF